MNPAPGWYHADGDPEGTVRLWSGTEWVGFSQRDPRTADPLASVQPFEPTLGQTRLRPIAIATQISLILYAAGHALFAYADLQLARAIEADIDLTSGEVSFEGTNDDSVTQLFGLVATTMPLLQLLCGILFLIWFYTAYSNLSKWRKTRYATGWAVFTWFVPFLVWFRPGKIMMELMEHSPGRGHEGAINPVWAVVWVIFWISPQFVYTVLLGYLRNNFWQVFEDPTSLASAIFYALAANSALAVCGLVVAVVIVNMVTEHQDSRLRPSRQQVELAQREAELMATLTPGAGGTF